MLCCHVWPVSTPRHKADGEQQQDHADLRQQFDRVGVLDEPQGRGAAQDAGQQEPHDGRDFDLVADEQDADGKAENGDDVRKKRDVHSSGGSIKAERMNSTFFPPDVLRYTAVV